ncbi:MAG: hypothetical protein PHN71_03055 [Candidatus Cloacimonetes bacterium]|jgi:hypothetical protein|nr:hypothetical protein [Candidatus Cloacimonadota bacterium]MDY0298811.1 hypothetical protein [Candidatus Cloacimonadaceae bacterium]MCB5278849.1 hypothetical protein [Candidatus Cloacimonadota bacterium]MCK9333039.1 hypothetical protein [Candidatus Cloacimonadota bacterium]MDD2210284.1 hypothetical protein [Candidatus Cloacimonadota bacterium]
MKVKFTKLLMGYEGKIDDAVMYFSPKRRKYILRKRPKYVEQAQNRSFSQIQKRIFALPIRAEYKQDIRNYLLKYNALPGYSDHPIYAWNLLYSKLMWDIARLYKIDLKSIAVEDLPSLPCITIATAVERGILPKVNGYERFIESMV